jgi:hypothetical protein
MTVGRQYFADNYPLATAAGKCSRPTPENGSEACIPLRINHAIGAGLPAKHTVANPRPIASNWLLQPIMAWRVDQHKQAPIDHSGQLVAVPAIAVCSSMATTIKTARIVTGVANSVFLFSRRQPKKGTLPAAPEAAPVGKYFSSLLSRVCVWQLLPYHLSQRFFYRIGFKPPA